MAKHKVVITGIDTSQIKVLKNDEVYELINKGIDNQEVFDKLVYGNLRLVLSVVKKFKDRYDNLDDLFQIGTIGLMKAIRNFDVSYNLKFSTYAVVYEDKAATSSDENDGGFVVILVVAIVLVCGAAAFVVLKKKNIIKF